MTNRLERVMTMWKLEKASRSRCALRGLAAMLAALTLCPAAAFAHSGTAPLPMTQEEAVCTACERLSVCDLMHACNGVSVSKSWMKQAKIGECFLNIRLHRADGEQVVFKQNLMKTEDESLSLVLRGRGGDGMLLQLDQPALDALGRLGVTEIVVTDANLWVQAAYETADLSLLRSVFDVGENEILSVCGEDNPVTAVSLDGVRRYLTF